MDAAIVVAVIALAGSAISAAIALYGQLHTTRLTARREAEATLAKYREPLIDAANDLQARLYNILRREKRFLRSYYLSGSAAEREYALQHTLYVVAQYFGWSEILRQEIQFLSFPDARGTRTVSDLQEEIRFAFSSDTEAFGRPFRVWRGDQRAIGESMIVRSAGQQLHCLGYARFVERTEPSFRRWFAALEQDVATVAEQPNERLLRLQNALVDLILELDGNRRSGGLRARRSGPRLVRFSPDRLTKLERQDTLLEDS